jgi:hypothetical protein
LVVGDFPAGESVHDKSNFGLAVGFSALFSRQYLINIYFFSDSNVITLILMDEEEFESFEQFSQ